MKRSFDIVLLNFLMIVFANGQTNIPLKKYFSDVTAEGEPVVSNHLKLGGANTLNQSIAINSFYFLVDGKPFIPVTGEFHFSRYPNRYWEESLKKMKAGGINIIATYVFWNIHEETEGKFDWEGDKNLRTFIELCKKNNFKVIVRIGPFCHGEIRNGGLPDWLFARPFSVRSNDPEYLAYVETLYKEIGKQLEGFYFSDGGPVIGIQLENEYQHSASPWAITYPGQPPDWTVADRDRSAVKEGVSVAHEENPYAQFGKEHMRVLKAIAERAGLIVPLYTATGWGNAAVIEDESIPVTAAYPYPTWVPASSLSSFYLFTDLRKNPDYSPVRYSPGDYPYFPAEIGGGMANNYNRRPTIPPESIDALINRFLGSGSNGVGYYMYHGGATPKGERYFFSDEAYAYPKINYDYQAPIGQYGQIKPSFHRLKLLHFFMNSFGDRLAPMSLYLPETNSIITPSDTVTLRYSVRAKDGKGFIFINNFQDYLDLGDKTGLQIRIRSGKGDVIVPEAGGFSLKNGENMILPFNLDMGGINLNYATAQLLTTVGNVKNPCYVFFATHGTNGEFSIAKTNVSKVSGKSCTIESDRVRWLIKCSGTSEFIISRKGGGEIKVIMLEKDLALKSWQLDIKGIPHLAFSDAMILNGKESAEFLSTGKNSFDIFIYPRINSAPKTSKGKITDKSGESPVMSKFRIDIPEARFEIKTERFGENKIQITFPDQMAEGLNDVFLRIKYTGDTGMCFVNDELVDDQFYYGHPWEIGLKKFYDRLQVRKMFFYFRPMTRNATYLVDLAKESIPDFSNAQTYLKINNIETVQEYHGFITFN